MTEKQQAIEIMEKEIAKQRKDVTDKEMRFAAQFAMLSHKINNVGALSAECLLTDIQTHLDAMKKLNSDITITRTISNPMKL